LAPCLQVIQAIIDPGISVLLKVNVCPLADIVL
jgi:hypothetical protein